MVRAASDARFRRHPGALAPAEIARVLEDLNRATSLRSRAGVRQALKIDSVAALARSLRLSEIAGQVLGHEALPYKATLFEKSPLQIGLLYGTRTQLSLCANAGKRQAGDPGP